MTDSKGAFSITVPFPSDIDRCGLALVSQAAIFAPGGPLGFVQITNAMHAVVGS